LKILLVVPSYNEEKSISNVINEILQLTTDYQLDYMVVNDGSTDNTSLVIKQISNNLIELPINLGIGGAVQTGFLFAKENNYNFAVQLDGDGQHPPGEIMKLVNAAITNNFDIVIGSRFLTDTGFQSTQMRRIGINILSYLLNCLCGLKIYDISSGFRILNKKAIEIACRYYPDEYPEPESLLIFKRKGLRITEVPITMRKRQWGKSSIAPIHSIYYMAKVSLALLYSSMRYNKI
jgi:glycosyltransferase involved in cell wall biosynthesis